MKKYLDQVKEFHTAFSVYSQDKPSVKIPEHIKKLRQALLQEEVDELKEAMDEGNLAHIAKEMADIVYVLFGTVHAYGLGHLFESIFSRVHESNMSKLDARGQPIMNKEKTKIIKSSLYKEPDLTDILK